MKRKQNFDAFLLKSRQELGAAIERLEQEGRQDEANLNKVRLNIVTVFETVANADLRAAGSQDWEAFANRYQPRFASLSAPWRAKLEAARRHGDVSATAVEEAKIETAVRIEAAFHKAKG